MTAHLRKHGVDGVLFYSIVDKDAAEPEEPQPEEVERILGLLGDEIRRSRRSQRAIERALHLSQGYLGSLLRGRIKLKVSHLYLLGRELGFEPAVLLIRAAPPKDPQSIAKELARELESRPEDSRPMLTAAPAMTSADIEDLVRRTVRLELARLGGG